MIRPCLYASDAPRLEARDVAALRAADSVVFRHVDGAGSRLELAKRNPRHARDAFALQELRHEIRAFDYLLGAMSGADPRCGGREIRGFDAFGMISTAQYDDEWKTVAASLRAGDRVGLVWYLGGAETEGLREAGFTGDFVRLEARRGAGEKESRLVWRVDSTIAPRHSSALMIRPRAAREIAA